MIQKALEGEKAKEEEEGGGGQYGPKKKVGLLIAYCGGGYQGLQM